jgi:DNA-directed RNA polymerase alpha subunit
MRTEKRSAQGQIEDEAKRRALHPAASRQAIADSQPEPGFRENHRRLKADRLAREAATAPMLEPTPELPDDTPIDRVGFPPRLRGALTGGDLKTVGDVRQMSDRDLLSLQELGLGSLTYLREMLGLPSCDGVRPLGKKPI